MKNVMTILSVFIITVNTAFAQEKKANTSDNTKSVKQEVAQDIKIGMHYGGGIVAYILQVGDPGYNPSTKHGLIVAPSDQASEVAWGCFAKFIGAVSTELGAGKANTILIANICGIGSAAYICDTLTLNGYSDWYLPSKDELNIIYLNRAAIGSFDTTFDIKPSRENYTIGPYWSSSESDPYFAWHQSMVTGDQDSLGGKDEKYFFVRAIRSF